jgi:hypothetical protein
MKLSRFLFFSSLFLSQKTLTLIDEQGQPFRLDGVNFVLDWNSGRRFLWDSSWVYFSWWLAHFPCCSLLLSNHWTHPR